MIRRSTPKNKENYIMVDSETSNILYAHGFIPKYMDFQAIYYIKSDELIEFMRKGGLKCKN